MRSAWNDIGSFFKVVVAYRERLRAEARAQIEKSDAMGLLALSGERGAAQPTGDTLVPGALNSFESSLITIREELRVRLKDVEAALGKVLSEREKYFALFPIVIYVDEVLRTETQGRADNWESLQSELYGISDGGERFYTVLDELLRLDSTHPIVFEVFYFCLSHGFTGQYSGEHATERTDALRQRLALRIPTADIPTERGASTTVPVRIRSVPWHYYAFAACGVLGVHGLLRVVGYASGGFQ